MPSLFDCFCRYHVIVDDADFLRCRFDYAADAWQARVLRAVAAAAW